jgi:hypothetical protein
MLTALALLLAAQASPAQEAAALLRRAAEAELAAERVESAQALLAVAGWIEPSDEAKTLEEEAFRKLRAAKSLARAPIDLSAVTDSPFDGFVARLNGKSKSARTAKGAKLVVGLDGEKITLEGSNVSRKREKPGEIEPAKLILVSDDEILAIEGTTLRVLPKKAPAALAGRLLASKDPREQIAGALLYSIRNILAALQRLNDHRLAAGVAPVGLSGDLTYGAFLHSRYLANEDPAKIQGMAMHDEVDGSPWKSAEGLRAARNGCISSFILDCAVDQLMATLYHRVPMVAPDLARVGIGHWEKNAQYFSVIDVQSARDKTPRAPVMVPADGQKGVPVRFAVGETPDPRPKEATGIVGYPITLSWYGGGEAAAALKDARGAEVECWVSTPKAPANASRPDNASSVCLIPKKPLKAASAYTVTVTAGGKTWSWSFTTR